jgi:hypothetical protein
VVICPVDWHSLRFFVVATGIRFQVQKLTRFVILTIMV